MSAKVFVDTNILIYAHDADASTKHAVAKGVLQQLWNERSGTLSTQVLQEFYVNVTRKIASPYRKKPRAGLFDGIAFGIGALAMIFYRLFLRISAPTNSLA